MTHSLLVEVFPIILDLFLSKSVLRQLIEIVVKVEIQQSSYLEIQDYVRGR